MIIYKLQENGRATDFQYSQTCPEGWKSIPGDRIPEDITPYHEQRFIDEKALKDQEKELLNLISSNEYHLISRRFAEDKSIWESKLDEWAAQLEEVNNGNLVEIAALPDFS